ncbi:tRNA-splicing endonuclease subunit Sen34-like [Oscarella lobularis]|uniref:tRNA-splicing endonuclease subunit Sen34-like n=1 Tax=Oscarella lobularis TaxID=121494 RepID=UPI003313C375
MLDVYVSNGQALVWNADDATTLRKDFRIVGTPIGSLPRNSQQNLCLGLPLLLMPEQATLLQEKKIIRLRSYREPQTMSQAQIDLFEKERQDSTKTQEVLVKGQREQIKADYLSGKIEPKKKSKKQKKKEEEDASEEPKPKQPKLDKEAKPAPPQPCYNPTIKITKADPFASLNSLTSCPEWTYPSKEQEILKYSIFKDLWEKDYYIASGAKFGGDYLIYPADPTLVHSHYVAIVKQWSESMTCFDVISSGRLGTKVKKNALYCSIDPKGNPVYVSAQWTGIV